MAKDDQGGDGLRIISLQIENIKKIVAIGIKPDGNIVEITGRNGSGKTSILDAIWWAFAGAGNIQEEPIRKGEEQARIRLDLGEIIVTRTFKPGKDGGTTSALTVENTDGARFTSPQSMLDEFLGVLSFDPLSFSRMSPKEQFDIMASFVPDVDFDAIADANRADYANRTAANRQAKEARTKAEGIKVEFENNVPEKIDQSAIFARMDEASKHNADIETRKANRLRMIGRINELRSKAAEYETEASVVEEKLESADPLPEPINTDAIQEDFEAASKNNAEVDLHSERKEFTEVAEDAHRISTELTNAIAERERMKREAIEKATLPVDGLEFGDGNIILNGIPFEQASDAEQLKISVAIAMALNPKLRIIRVRDGSLLDEKSMAAICEMADKANYQLWIERVDSSGRVGFVIEDGRLKKGKQNGEG